MYTESRGHYLDFRWIGDNSGSKPIVFLHEGLGSIELWRHFPKEVVDGSGHRGLVFSRYGHGRSDVLRAPRSPRFMHDEALQVLPGLIDDLVGESPILVGHSDGASIALIYAGAGHPVDGLVLIAPHVMVEKAGLDQIAFLNTSYQTGDLPERLARYHNDADATFRGWADVWLSEQFTSWNIEEYLPTITCPILMIQSKKDDYGTLTHLDIIEASTSGPVTRLEVEGNSHSPHLSEADLVIEATTRFVEEL